MRELSVAPNGWPDRLSLTGTECHSSLEDETNLVVRWGGEEWPGHIITIYHCYAARAGLKLSRLFLFIDFLLLWSLTPCLSRDQITPPNLVNSGQARSQLWLCWQQLYDCTMLTTEHTSLSLLSDDRNGSRGCCACPAHSIIFQPEKICPENFNNENILTVKCSTAPRWGHLPYPTLKIKREDKNQENTEIE